MRNTLRRQSVLSPWSSALRSLRSLSRRELGQDQDRGLVLEVGILLDGVPQLAELLVVAPDHLDVAVVGAVGDVGVLQRDARGPAA